MTSTMISKVINVNYQTDDMNVSFNLEFGKAIDSDIEQSAYIRKEYKNPYDIEHQETDGSKMYMLLAEEGPFAMKVTNVDVQPKDKVFKKATSDGYITYDYGLAVVLDMNYEPEYCSPTSFTHCNFIERDGRSWVVKNNKTLLVDQNGEAQFQWSTAKALDKGVKPTEEQELRGVEERHENTGMIYLTFQPIYTEEIHYHPKELTRGFSSQSTLTRGFSSAARVGYGSQASTNSKIVSAIAVYDSRYILPIRLRIVGDTSEYTKCAKSLKSAMYVHDLQNKTSVFPDSD